MLTHLGRTGCTVEADHVDAECGETGQCSADLATEKHGSGGLDCDRNNDWQAALGCGHGALGADNGRFCLKQVLCGLDDHGIDTAVDQAGNLLLIGVTKQRIGCVPERWQLGAWAHRSEHPARACLCRVQICCFARDLGAGLCEFEDARLDAVFGEVGQVSAESIGLDCLGAGL